MYRVLSDSDWCKGICVPQELQYLKDALQSDETPTKSGDIEVLSTTSEVTSDSVTPAGAVHRTRSRMAQTIVMSE